MENEAGRHDSGPAVFSPWRMKDGSFRKFVWQEKCLHAGAVFQYNTSNMDGSRLRDGCPFYLYFKSQVNMLWNSY